MRQDFAKKIDGLLIQLLDIFDEHGRGSIQSLRIAINRALEDAEEMLATDPNWDYAKFAIVSWIDHEATKLDENWQYSTLERRFFNSADAHNEFFRRAEESSNDGRFDALEVFFLCYLFGFRGIYDPARKSEYDRPANLPQHDFEWQSEMAKRIKGASSPLGTDWIRTMSRERNDEELRGRSIFTNSLLFFVFGFLLLGSSCGYLLYKTMWS